MCLCTNFLHFTFFVLAFFYGAFLQGPINPSTGYPTYQTDPKSGLKLNPTTGLPLDPQPSTDDITKSNAPQSLQSPSLGGSDVPQGSPPVDAGGASSAGLSDGALAGIGLGALAGAGALVAGGVKLLNRSKKPLGSKVALDDLAAVAVKPLGEAGAGSSAEIQAAKEAPASAPEPTVATSPEDPLEKPVAPILVKQKTQHEQTLEDATGALKTAQTEHENAKKILADHDAKVADLQRKLAQNLAIVGKKTGILSSVTVEQITAANAEITKIKAEIEEAKQARINLDGSVLQAQTNLAKAQEAKTVAVAAVKNEQEVAARTAPIQKQIDKTLAAISRETALKNARESGDATDPEVAQRITEHAARIAKLNTELNEYQKALAQAQEPPKSLRQKLGQKMGVAQERFVAWRAKRAEASSSGGPSLAAKLRGLRSGFAKNLNRVFPVDTSAVSSTQPSENAVRSAEAATIPLATRTKWQKIRDAFLRNGNRVVLLDQAPASALAQVSVTNSAAPQALVQPQASASSLSSVPVVRLSDVRVDVAPVRQAIDGAGAQVLQAPAIPLIENTQTDLAVVDASTKQALRAGGKKLGDKSLEAPLPNRPKIGDPTKPRSKEVGDTPTNPEGFRTPRTSVAVPAIQAAAISQVDSSSAWAGNQRTTKSLIEHYRYKRSGGIETAQPQVSTPSLPQVSAAPGTELPEKPMFTDEARAKAQAFLDESRRKAEEAARIKIKEGEALIAESNRVKDQVQLLRIAASNGIKSQVPLGHVEQNLKGSLASSRKGPPTGPPPTHLSEALAGSTNRLGNLLAAQEELRRRNSQDAGISDKTEVVTREIGVEHQKLREAALSAEDLPLVRKRVSYTQQPQAKSHSAGAAGSREARPPTAPRTPRNSRVGHVPGSPRST